MFFHTRRAFFQTTCRTSLYYSLDAKVRQVAGIGGRDVDITDVAFEKCQSCIAPSCACTIALLSRQLQRLEKATIRLAVDRP